MSATAAETPASRRHALATVALPALLLGGAYVLGLRLPLSREITAILARLPGSRATALISIIPS